VIAIPTHRLNSSLYKMVQYSCEIHDRLLRGECYQREENENEGSLETPDELGLTCTDKALVGNPRIATSLTLLISSNSHSSLYSRFSTSLPTCNAKRNFRLVKSNSVDTLEADDHCQLAVPSETRQLRYSLPCSKCPHRNYHLRPRLYASPICKRFANYAGLRSLNNQYASLKTT
jgi:hypothetical protein